MSLSKCQDDGVQMRGAINQEPIIVEAENRDRRFVLVPEAANAVPPKDKSSFSSGLQEKTQPGNEKPPPLKMDINHVDEATTLPRREPKPYSYTPTQSQRVSGEYFLSPESATTSTAKSPRSVPAQDEVLRQRDSMRPMEGSRDSSAFRSRMETSDESDLDVKSTLKFRSRTKSARVSFTDLSGSATLLSPGGTSGPSRKLRTPSPHYDDLPTTLKPDSRRDLSPRATTATDPNTPRSIPVPKSGRSESVYGTSPTRHEFSRSASYTAAPVWPPSPPRSPKVTASSSSNDSRKSSDSRPESRPGSRSSSPICSSLDVQQATAALSRSISAQSDRYATYPPAQKQKPAKPTPLSTSMRQESVEELPKLRTDVRSPTPVRPVKSSALPYPEDDHNFLMPAEADFSPAPRGLGVSFPSLDPPERPQSAIPPSTTYKPKPKPSPRPELPSRHSLAEGLPKAKAEPVIKGVSFEPTPKKESLSSSSSSQLPVLPPCPRKDYSRKYDDWYTVQGFEAFHVCPSCLEDIVLPTSFHKYFKRSPSRPSSVRTKCDFGSPWIRLAWLLTTKRRRQDLDLLYGISKAAATEPECPGATEATGTMYGIPLENGAFLPSFALCPTDKKNVETLFPSLVGCFTRFPSSVKVDKICALRTSSKRFATYLDVLVDVDEKAQGSAKAKADLAPLVELAKGFAYKQECQRDRILVDQTWHFPPGLPELTVCEECFDELVYPHIKKGPSIADKFNRTLQPLHPTLSDKSTCQLYSARMRRVWERSVEKGDWEYLKRKVRERRQVENELREQQVEIMKMLNRGGGVYAGAGGVDRERLKKELDRIELEWSEWE